MNVLIMFPMKMYILIAGVLLILFIIILNCGFSFSVVGELPVDF